MRKWNYHPSACRQALDWAPGPPARTPIPELPGNGVGGRDGGGTNGNGGSSSRPVTPANPSTPNPSDIFVPPLPEGEGSKEYQPLPKIGDLGRIGLYGMLTLLSGSGLVMSWPLKKRKYNKEV